MRADRDTKPSGKSKGGGLIMYVNNRWCNPGHISTKTVSCCRDLELLAVSLQPYYLPREFSHVITVCVYIPPSADAATARENIHSVTARLQTQHPEAFMIISGEFNHATLDSTLAVFHQVVDSPTRNNRTIDLLYANVRDAYRVTPLPRLDKSDHNLRCSSSSLCLRHLSERLSLAVSCLSTVLITVRPVQTDRQTERLEVVRCVCACVCV